MSLYCLWNGYLLCGVPKQDVLVAIQIGAYIHKVLIFYGCLYYPESTKELHIDNKLESRQVIYLPFRSLNSSSKSLATASPPVISSSALRA